MGLKILHSADWHLGSPFGSVPEDVRAAMSKAQESIPMGVARLCAQEQCNLVLLSGDLFDTPAPGRKWVDSVKQALESCAVPVFISPGNHDFCGSDSPWLLDTWPENVHIFTNNYIEHVDLEELDCRIYGAGYRGMDCPGLLEGFRADGNQRWCIGSFHGDPLVPSSPCCPVTGSQVRESGLDYLALGHIHAAGSFRAGSTLCAWPGCPMGRGWDETEEKGVYVVTLEQRAEVRFVPLGLPQFHDLTVLVRGDAKEVLEAILPGAAVDDLFRVTLTGRGNVDVEALQKQYPHLALLVLRDETVSPRPLWDCAGEDSLRGLYFQMLQELSQNPETEGAAKLAAEISGDLLDDREVVLP